MFVLVIHLLPMVATLAGLQLPCLAGISLPCSASFQSWISDGLYTLSFNACAGDTFVANGSKMGQDYSCHVWQECTCHAVYLSKAGSQISCWRFRQQFLPIVR
jgi:hypothetical protein